ncbi:MAG: hypothetical protein B7X04_04250 [Parcubacteria group bacterium 21-54-25]|nr:MAG: hypothetical protein B7X04_04250 [Parcubacteria group bacterium 21-54-25]HQU08124.1 hypothetical protein [Candidatus Paceibacterota bacterium]
MDEDLKTLLTENLRVAKDNNRMLRAMRRAAVVGAIGRVIFWILVLGVPAYLYVTYVAPLASHIMAQSAATGQNPLAHLFGVPTSDTLQQVLHTVASTTKGL